MAVVSDDAVGYKTICAPVCDKCARGSPDALRAEALRYIMLNLGKPAIPEYECYLCGLVPGWRTLLQCMDTVAGILVDRRMVNDPRFIISWNMAEKYYQTLVEMGSLCCKIALGPRRREYAGAGHSRAGMKLRTQRN